MSLRKAKHAGTFYPGSPQKLQGLLDELLQKNAQKNRQKALPKALIVPHAGYAYSGITAGISYSELLDATDITRVILLAPSHYVYIDGAVAVSTTYECPIGVIHSDIDAISKLENAGFDLVTEDSPFAQEHSDEVQIPFILSTMPNAKLISIIAGELSPQTLEKITPTLTSIVNQHTVLICSSDFTHQGPRFKYMPFKGESVSNSLSRFDKEAIDTICELDGDAFRAFLEKTSATICGASPIILLLSILKKLHPDARGKLLHYTNSGKITGDWTNTVSYAGISFQ